MQRRRATIAAALAAGASIVWLLALLPSLSGRSERPVPPDDFLSYRAAADELRRRADPYGAPEAALDTWRSFHADEVALSAAARDGRGADELRAQHLRPRRPGPYVYPPTLARIVAVLDLSVAAFSVATALSILGFAWLWLRWTGGSFAWLALVLGSWDVLATLYLGNVEQLLLLVGLIGAWLMWQRRGALAAPWVALALLLKPFYALLFAVVALLQLGPATERRQTLRALAILATLALGLVALDVLLWGETLRRQAFGYLRHAFAYQWFVLPVAEQTPMSTWNRAPLQALVNLGAAPAVAQRVAATAWLLLAGVTAWRLRGRALPFPVVFALAFTLLYLGRPVGWTLVYLELVVGVAVWPALSRRWQRAAFLVAAVALMASHWWAALLTARAPGMPFVTLQRPERPWESLLVLPAAWLVTLWAAERQTERVRR
jgi:hypothetical protein